MDDRKEVSSLSHYVSLVLFVWFSEGSLESLNCDYQLFVCFLGWFGSEIRNKENPSEEMS